MSSKFSSEDFSISKLQNNIYMVRENFYRSQSLANIWVVNGSSSDLIIDTGTGLWDLPGFLKKHGIIGNKPFEAVATHIHFDHSGGAHQFEKFSIHRLEVDAIKSGDQTEIGSHMTAREIVKTPKANWNPRHFRVPAKRPTRVLDDGDVFDLGNRKLRVMHLPGHTRGSIALYEEETRSLFSGDIVYINGPLLDMLPFSNIQDYMKTAESLKQLSPYVDVVLPGHNVIFDGTTLNKVLTDYISSKQACCDGVKTALAGAAFNMILNGRNSEGCNCHRCCYVSCCCYHLIGCISGGTEPPEMPAQ